MAQVNSFTIVSKGERPLVSFHTHKNEFPFNTFDNAAILPRTVRQISHALSGLANMTDLQTAVGGDFFYVETVNDVGDHSGDHPGQIAHGVNFNIRLPFHGV